MAQPTTLPSSGSSSRSGFSLPSSFPNPTRLRSYVLRLPLFTRLTILIILVLYIISLQSAWSVVAWGALKPSVIGIFTGGMYRLNTYPFVHRGFWHMLFNLLALVPLFERFEKESGTLTSAALWLGPLATLPGGMYIGIERGIFGGDAQVVGASVWVFLLLAVEAVRSSRGNPFFDVAGVKIPTWSTPLILVVVVSVLISGTSFTGHVCGLAIGYLWGLGYIRFLAPPDKAIRWIEGKLNLLGRVPHYVSVDQKTYGRYGVLPTSANEPAHANAIGLGWVGTNGGQRLGST